MSRDGAGTYNLPEAAFVYDTVISETAMNSNLSDIASALTASIAKDGQTTPTANLPMGGYKLTGMGVGSAATDSAHLGQVQAQAWSWCGTAGGTKNALTLTPSPAITAYAAGQSFRAIIGGTSSDDAVTVAVSGLTTKDVEIDGSACSATVFLETGKIYQFDYDGTAFKATRLSLDVSSFQSNVITTRGDLIYGNSSGVAARLALGTTGYVPVSDGTDVAWGQVVTAGIADDAVDPIKAVAGVNAQTGTTYTYAMTDNLKTVAHSNASAIAATIPTNASVAFTADEVRIDIVNEGAGNLTVSGDTGVTVNGVSAGSFTLTQYQGASIIKRGTDTWVAPNQTVA